MKEFGLKQSLWKIKENKRKVEGSYYKEIKKLVDVTSGQIYNWRSKLNPNPFACVFTIQAIHQLARLFVYTVLMRWYIWTNQSIYVVGFIHCMVETLYKFDQPPYPKDTYFGPIYSVVDGPQVITFVGRDLI